MQQFQTHVVQIYSIVAFLAVCSCSTQSLKPCSLGGQSARDDRSTFRGIKRCYQTPDGDGRLVNNGKYFEWYNNDKIALTGQYKNGKKIGRWTEYDEQGQKVSEKYFEDGKEVPLP